MRIARSKSDWMSKPLSGDAPMLRCGLVPGEDSSTGNVSGGRKLARYVLNRLDHQTRCDADARLEGRAGLQATYPSDQLPTRTHGSMPSARAASVSAFNAAFISSDAASGMTRSGF
jgi:hypothetical protein